MQQVPYQLSRAIRCAFIAARPIHQPNSHLRPLVHWRNPVWSHSGSRKDLQTRQFADKPSSIDAKAKDAKSRIDDSIQARADAAHAPDTKLKDPRDETIVHTSPEASSIVHASVQDSEGSPKPLSPKEQHDSDLPSHSNSNASHLRRRFSHFMDNYQTYLFSASRSLNDLTGYTGIEHIKNKITDQEGIVQTTRKTVDSARTTYSEAIKTRSQTQREVNDLLHRKNNWSSDDLNRFTTLYQADHTNEQEEQQAQRQVSEAEAKYEEASTTLARSILARYHEEQIWSDKIRQMSTWGTWGLMGLNVLLFIVFQIAVEPWRRRRLVRGFEEKVELALQERDEHIKALSSGMVRPNVEGAAAAVSSAQQEPEDIADHIASAIVDAVSGTGDVPSAMGVEAAAESVVSGGIASDRSAAAGNKSFASATTGYAYYEEAIRKLFSERKMAVTQREMTNTALEGAAGGAALMGLLFVFFRPR